VEQTADGKLQLTITDPILDRPVVLTPTFWPWRLRCCPIPCRISGNLQGAPKCRRLLERAHAKLRPVDLPRTASSWRGWPLSQPIDESIAQPRPRRAGRHLPVQEYRGSGGIVAVVEQDKCAVCLTCVRTCPFNVPVIDYTVDAAYIDPAKCRLRRLRLGVPG